MSTKILVVALTALVTVSSAQNRSCGPFEITSPSGTLFSTSGGYQYPDPYSGEVGSTEFYINDEGSITNSSYAPCTFYNGMLCSFNYQGDKLWQIGSDNQISWHLNNTFYLCPSGAVNFTGLPTTTPTDIFLESALDTYKLRIGSDPTTSYQQDGDCWLTTIQASRCVNQSEYRESPLPIPPRAELFPTTTPSTSSTSGTATAATNTTAAATVATTSATSTAVRNVVGGAAALGGALAMILLL